MNIIVTDQEQCKKQVRLEIPGDLVRAETDRVATTLARQVNVAGFRRGHVPASVVKTRFRKELRDEVLGHLLPHALGDAIREKDLKVIGEPSLDELNFGDDQSISVTFTVEVAPEFELADYKNIPLVKHDYKVRDEDVEKAIDSYRERQAELVPVEDRPAQPGDHVTVNMTGKIGPLQQQAGEAEGEKAEGAEQQETPSPDAPQELAESGEAGGAAQSESGQGEPAQAEPEQINQQDVDIELGARGILKEFTEALTGARPGDTRAVSIEYPEDYTNKQLAGRRATYTLEVTAVRAKELPEFSDEFAQSVSEEFNTADELRAGVRSKMEREAQHKAESELQAAVLEQLADRNRFDVPEFVVGKEMDSRIQTLVRQLSYQGIDPRQMQVDWGHIRESQREQAEREVRATFVLDRIAEAEQIEVSEDELDQEIERIAQGMGETTAALKARLTKEGALDTIRGQVRNRKALDLVIASADIRTEEVEGLNKENKGTGDEGGQAGGQGSS
jgi:trigger factor